MGTITCRLFMLTYFIGAPNQATVGRYFEVVTDVGLFFVFVFFPEGFICSGRGHRPLQRGLAPCSPTCGLSKSKVLVRDEKIGENVRSGLPSSASCAQNGSLDKQANKDQAGREKGQRPRRPWSWKEQPDLPSVSQG